MVVNNNAASWLLSEITHDFDNSFIRAEALIPRRLRQGILILGAFNRSSFYLSILNKYSILFGFEDMTMVQRRGDILTMGDIEGVNKSIQSEGDYND